MKPILHTTISLCLSKKQQFLMFKNGLITLFWILVFLFFSYENKVYSQTDWIVFSKTNTTPVAIADTVRIPQNFPFEIDVLANDYDLDEPLSPCNVTLVSLPTMGTAFQYPTPTCQLYYLPTANYCGLDSFQYQVCDSQSACSIATVFITVSCNLFPQAIGDLNSTPENTSAVLDLTANDSDPEDGSLDPCNASIYSIPQNGTATYTACVFIYTPNGGFCGTDSFQYQVCDSQGDCSTAWSIVDVICSNSPPNAVVDVDTAFMNTLTYLDLISNDSDTEDGVLDPCNASITITPSHGVATYDTCTFSYMPDFGYCGNDSFYYEICDSGGACSQALVFINVNCQVSPPIANMDVFETEVNTPSTIDVLANDQDAQDDLCLDANISVSLAPNNGIVSLGSCAFVYEPNLNFCGQDSFEYQLCDSDNMCDTAVVTIYVRCLQIDLKMFLAGPFNSGDSFMDDDLRSNGSLPVTEPYTTLGYDRGAAVGGETIANPNLLTSNDSTAIVDWILLEVRIFSDTSTAILTTKAALLRRDGQVVDVDGTYPVLIEGVDMLESPVIKLAVRHRNHLSSINEEPCFNLCTQDFTTNATLPGQISLPDGIHYGLQSGSADGNDSVDASDRSLAWNNRNASGYLLSDVNMDNVVDANDRSIIWNNRNQSVILPD